MADQSPGRWGAGGRARHQRRRRGGAPSAPSALARGPLAQRPARSCKHACTMTGAEGRDGGNAGSGGSTAGRHRRGSRARDAHGRLPERAPGPASHGAL